MLPDGATAAGNGVGILIDNGSNNLIGGTTTQERNVISGNSEDGIQLNAGASGNVITGNYIGTNTAGTSDLGNAIHGVLLSGQSNRLGGPSSAESNVISGNLYGVSVHNGEDVSIIGNLIGVDAAGVNALGNDAHAVNVNTSSVGILVRANVLSGNFGHGLILSGLSNNTIVQGNFIGTRADGATLVPNQLSGIAIVDSSSNTIGATGSGAGAGNVIAGNTNIGVEVFSAAFNNTIRRNSIFSNGLLGIDLIDYGVTGNDTGDADSGGNDAQNFPALDSVTSAEGMTTVTGSFNSTPNSTFAFDLYSNTACDPSGHGEGEKLVQFLHSVHRRRWQPHV